MICRMKFSELKGESAKKKVKVIKRVIDILIG